VLAAGKLRLNGRDWESTGLLRCARNDEACHCERSEAIQRSTLNVPRSTPSIPRVSLALNPRYFINSWQRLPCNDFRYFSF